MFLLNKDILNLSECYFTFPVVDREQGSVVKTCTEGVDDCGLRYTLAARHHVYLLNTLALRQRRQLQLSGLSPAMLVWAFHSEAEEVSLSLLERV